MMYLVLAALLGVLLIGFFIVVWKASPNWRWYNIVAVCITMILAVVFLFPTAGVLKSRAAWHQIKESLEIELANLENEKHSIKYGDPEDPTFGVGVVDLGIQLSKVGIEAGRRWPNLKMLQMNNNQVVLGKAPDNAGGVAGVPGNPAPAPAAANGDPLIPVGMVVYGFGEVPDQSQQLLPTVYFGEYRVTASTPDSATLSPTSALELSQRFALQNLGQPSWTLYELLPLDSHEPFIAAGSKGDEEFILGRVDDQLVGRLFDTATALIRNPQATGNEPLQTSQESKQRYLDDGRRATDDDPPMSRWWRVEFIQRHEIQVDSLEQRGALNGGFFDLNGRAVDSRLQRPDDDAVEFQKGDRVLLKEEAANKLVNDGVAELRDRYYLRPLNDYRYILRRVRLRLDELANRKTVMEYEEKVLKEAIEKTEGMIVENQSIREKLEQDKTQFIIEKEAIDEYATKMRSELEQMRTEMAQLHQHNLLLEKEIAEKHQAIERRLDGLSLVE